MSMKINFFRFDIDGNINDDYFMLIKRKKGKYQSILNDINYDNYWIYKSSNNQREVCKEDVSTFRDIFFKKDLYNKDYINYWIGIIIQLGGIQYLIKPFPPYDPNKIIIKK